LSSNPQLRHWMITVWPKHLDLEDCSDDEIIDAYLAEWKRIEEEVSPYLNWANAQIERAPDTGRLHIQGYTEWKDSKRRSEVLHHLSAHCEARLGSREDARSYCSKKTWKGRTKGQVLVLSNIGKWRSAKTSQSPSPKQRALELIKQGFTPADICRLDVEVYFTHYRSIEAVYNMIVKSGISIRTEEE